MIRRTIQASWRPLTTQLVKQECLGVIVRNNLSNVLGSFQAAEYVCQSRQQDKWRPVKRSGCDYMFFFCLFLLRKYNTQLLFSPSIPLFCQNLSCKLLPNTGLSKICGSYSIFAFPSTTNTFDSLCNFLPFLLSACFLQPH